MLTLLDSNTHEVAVLEARGIGGASGGRGACMQSLQPLCSARVWLARRALLRLARCARHARQARDVPSSAPSLHF